MIVAIQIKHFKEILAMLNRENGIFGDNFFGENDLFLFFCLLFAVDDHYLFLLLQMTQIVCKALSFL
jgi:hypothetical protein